MGKAALLIVAAFSAGATTLLFTSQEADTKASLHQAESQADAIAREIARSAYNAAVADVNRVDGDIDAAIQVVGDLHVSTAADRCRNGVASCYRRTGTMQGGTYIVEASRNGGIGADIVAVGSYAYTGVQDDEDLPNYGQQMRREKEYAINEFHIASNNPLEVAPDGAGGLLRIQFIRSTAGYCSAIFLQRTLPGVAAALQPAPEMVYAPGHNRDGEVNFGYETRLAPGTQMNFAIGVDTNCGSSGSRPTHHPALRKTAARNLFLTPDEVRSDGSVLTGAQRLAAEMTSYRFRTDDWQHIHWALDRAALLNGDVIEAPFGMVEVDPNNPQRWRIGFEDIPNWNLAPGHVNYDKPRHSLAATKRYGYDLNGDGRGDGWNDNVRAVLAERRNSTGVVTGYQVSHTSGQDGFHDLQDAGSWPDFDDQVIYVEVVPDRIASRR